MISPHQGQFDALLERSPGVTLSEFPFAPGPYERRSDLFWLDEEHHYLGLVQDGTNYLRNVTWVSNDDARAIKYDRPNSVGNLRRRSLLSPPLWMIAPAVEPTYRALLEAHKRRGSSVLVAQQFNSAKEFRKTLFSAPPFDYFFWELELEDDSVPMAITVFLGEVPDV